MSGRSMADLAAAYRSRVCAICGAPASVTCPGDRAIVLDAIAPRADGLMVHTQRVMRAEIPDINLCLSHASTRWPWKSEVRRTPR